MMGHPPRTVDALEFAIAAPQNITKVEAAFKDELARALKVGFSPQEVNAAKSGALQKLLQSRAQDGNLAGSWADKLFVGRTFEWSKAFEDKLGALTPDDLAQALRKYIDPARITVVKAGDFAKAAKAAS